MRRAILTLLAILALTLMSLPVLANDNGGDPFEISTCCDVDVVIEEIYEWEINHDIQDLVLDSQSDFGPFWGIGCYMYFVSTNMPWCLTGYWINGGDLEDNEDEVCFPEDWDIWWVKGLQKPFYDYQCFSEVNEGYTICDQGEGCEYVGFICFGLSGPTIHDPPGIYGSTLCFFLGPQ